MKYISKLIPKHDKLKHFYIGTLAFLFLTIFFNNLYSLVILFFAVSIWEFVQKVRGGSNTRNEMILDVFFGILTGIILNLI